jgi:transcriptional antiterminator
MYQMCCFIKYQHLNRLLSTGHKNQKWAKALVVAGIYSDHYYKYSIFPLLLFKFIGAMKEKATLKQIAKELNVSVSTVSKALNDSAEISGSTKIKIQEFAKLKNYKPNITALNLKNRSTKTIEVIVPNILNPFFCKGN